MQWNTPKNKDYLDPTGRPMINLWEKGYNFTRKKKRKRKETHSIHMGILRYVMWWFDYLIQCPDEDGSATNRPMSVNLGSYKEVVSQAQ
jgi:hypothetical protein